VKPIYRALGGEFAVVGAKLRLQGCGQVVGKQVQEPGRGVRMALFYDPKAGRDLTESKRLLRLQVKDFIDWLKGRE